MARINIEELYRGEGGGAKYGVGGSWGRYAGNHDPRRTEGIRRSDVYRAADHQAHAEGGGANENRGRLCVGNDRRGAALLLCGGIR